MPLYSYIPYLDPDIDEKEKKSFSGHFLDTDEESDAPKLEDDAAKLPNKMPVESFKRKVNENLKNFNNKMTDLLQDGLGGVDSICKQVKGLIHHDTKQVQSEKYIERCARGDVYDCTEEKKYNSPATDPSQDTVYFACHENEEKLREFQRGEGNNAFSTQTIETKDDIPPKRKVRSRPTSRSLRCKKSDPKCSKTKLSSKSFNATPKPSDTKKSTEKIKSKTKTKASKSRSLTQKESKPVDEARAKKRLGQIERDYQKVVENLGMVERMMACINERVASQKLKEDLTSQETVKSEERGVKTKKKATKPIKTKSTTQETGEESVSQTERENERVEEEKKTTKEVPRRKETNQQEKMLFKEIPTKKTIEEQTEAKTNNKLEQNKTKEDHQRVLVGESLRNPNNQNLFFQNPQTKIKINESLTDIDALIDNAVMELGSLVYTDFDMSRSSSDLSFKATNEEASQMKYEDCISVTSTSTSSDSETELLGKDSEKFEISRSFQELKDSYVQKIKQDTTGKTKKNKPKVQKKSSFDQLHEEIFNDSSWNRLDPSSFEGTFLKDSSDNDQEAATNWNPKEDKVEESKNEQDFAVMEAMLQTKVGKVQKEPATEEIITISLPSDKETRSSKKTRDFVSNIRKVDAEHLDEETLQITVTLAEDEEKPREISDTEENFEANRRQERSLRKQQKKKSKDKKIATKENGKTEKVPTPKIHSVKTSKEIEPEEEDDNITTVEVFKRESTEDTTGDTPKTKTKTKPKFKKKPKKIPQSDTVEIGPKDFTEIKKMESNFSVCSSYSSTTSFDDTIVWSKEDNVKEHTKPIDPMRQVSIQCKKLIGDLVVEDNTVSLDKMLDGYFNSPLIRTLVGRPKRPRSVRIHTPIQDPDLRSIVPEVHRKKAISDLHERMEYQIRQTDSFDGFLTLMNKTRRKALIKQAERQDHNFRCHMKTCFRKRYPFKVVTASVPPAFDYKTKEKKDPEKKFINSLWFSPKDFKLRRNSRIFNRKRMEMYCQSLHKGPMIPRCKCADTSSREAKRSEKASNYSILVRSGTPLGRRPNTPRRWIQLRPPTAGSGNAHRPRLHHCDILDDLTLKDLAPFNAEYPRNDERHITEGLQGSLLYKLACGGHKGDADGTLMDLIAPKLSCTQADCKICKTKSKTDKKPMRKIKKKPGDEPLLASSKTNELQNLSPKAAAQLLIQNIGEIKSKKSSTKSQASEKNLNRYKETKGKRSVKSLRKNSRKTLAQDSRLAIHQRLEENLVKKIFNNNNNHHVPPMDFVPKQATVQKLVPFKDQFQRALKAPELYQRPPARRSNVNRLFPYINDPDNKVFQNITVLPVKVYYDFEPLKDTSEKKPEEMDDAEATRTKGNSPVNITSLSETDELEVSTVERPRPSTAGDKNSKKKMAGKRRTGTPKSPTYGSRQSPNKYANLPPSPIGQPIDVTLTRKSKEILCVNQDAINPCRIPLRRQRYKRSSSLGKSTESDNPVSQYSNKKPGNPNPWKPASRRPRTPKTPPIPRSPINIRSKECTPSKTISAAKISPRQNYKHRESSSDSSRLTRETKDQPQMQVLVNKEKKLRFEVNPTRTFYDVDMTERRPQVARAPIQRCRPLSPSQKVMVDHLHMLRNRNTKLQGNIQKAINIIEEKMVDVLSTNDQSYKKRTIDRMEKEINKVLRMINEQNCRNVVDASNTSVQKTTFKDEGLEEVAAEEDSPTKALTTPAQALKMPKPPRKRSISRVLKFHSRPSTVEEERSNDFAEEPQLFRINEGVASDELEGRIYESQVEEKQKNDGEELETKNKRVELYPSPIEVDEAPLCPVLRCPTPKASFADLSRKTKKVMRKMSREAFGKFADVVKTKTRLIIDMTERIDMDDANLLPSPKVASAIPAILARSKLPVITTIHQPRAADLMSTTVSSIVSVHPSPFETVLNASADALSAATTEISEFANGCAERSITSFSESSSYTWQKFEHSQPMELECSTCSLQRKISHDLTPFMRALNNLKAGRLFEKRHHLLPIEETSPNFRKLMGFLEGLSKVKETFNQTTTRDQLVWNPEKRCSFHNSIAGFRKLRFRKNTKAISEHSIVQSSASSFSELISHMKIEEKPSETNISIMESKKEESENKEREEPTQIDEPKYVSKEESEMQAEAKLDHKSIKLVFSEVQLISISNNKNSTKRNKKKTVANLDCDETVLKLKDDRYSIFLKFFYLIFYTLVYFCMTAMNFSC